MDYMLDMNEECLYTSFIVGMKTHNLSKYYRTTMYVFIENVQISNKSGTPDHVQTMSKVIPLHSLYHEGVRAINSLYNSIICTIAVLKLFLNTCTLYCSYM